MKTGFDAYFSERMKDPEFAKEYGIAQKELNMIHSPLNYTGGKFKLLPQLLPLFPKEIDCFVDLFGGGFNVGINVEAESVIYNDLSLPVVQMLMVFRDRDTQDIVKQIEDNIKKYNLSKENALGYGQFRAYYNDPYVYSDPVDLFTLICYAFNNQIRFNSKGQYNMPFGKDRSSFNAKIKANLIAFCDKLKSMNSLILNRSFEDFNYSTLTSKDFVYCDPPYLLSVATYNERGGWTPEHDLKLFKVLDELNNRGIRFGMSNVTHHKGKVNQPLLDWASKYKTHELKHKYSNVSYQLKDRVSVSREVFITNYE